MSIGTLASSAALVRGHSGKDVEHPTWVVVGALAASLLERAAYEVNEGQTILLTFADPDGDFEVSPEANRGVVKLHHQVYKANGAKKNIKHVASVGYRKDDRAVVDINRGLLVAKGTKTVGITLAGDPDTVAQRVNADRLLSAAVMADAGHDVMLWTDGVDFRVIDLGIQV